MNNLNRLLVAVALPLILVSQTAVAEDAVGTLHDLQLSEGPPEPGFMASAMAGKLPVGNVTLSPAFKPDVTSYSAGASQRLLTIRARAGKGLKMDVTGTTAGGGELSAVNRFSIGDANGHGAFISITLSGLTSGENTVTVDITDAKDTAIGSYRVTVVREGPNLADLNDEEARGLLIPSIRDESTAGVVRAINAGANVNDVPPGKTGTSALILATAKENEEIVGLLIDAGADVNYMLPDQKFPSRNPSGATALLVAVGKENEKIVRRLIDAGADVNHTLPEQGFHSNSASGTSALLVAVGQENSELVRLLVSAGADVNYVLPKQGVASKSQSGASALLLAVDKRNEAIVRQLIEAGADVNSTLPDQKFPARGSTGGVSALMVAVNNGDEATVRQLIEAGADVNYRIPGKQRYGKNPKTAGLTALRVAKAKDHSGIVELLRGAGAKE